MKDKIYKEERRKILAIGLSLLLTILWVIMTAFSKKLYANVDNFNISLITNGLYGEDTYTYYLHPWLCSLIGIIARAVPSADGYVLLLHTLLVLAIWSNFFVIIKSKITIYGKIIFILSIITVTNAISIWNSNFTVQAAFFVLTGAVILISDINSWKLWYIIIGTIFVCFGFMWRMQGALLTIPFIGLDIIFRIIKNRENKQKIKRITITLILPVVCTVILIATQYATQNQEKFSAVLEYSAYRSAVEDFPVKSWDELSGNLDNVSETEYKAATSWVLIDTDNINSGLLEEIADKGQVNAYPFNVYGAFQALNKMFHFIITYRAWTFILGAIIFCCFIIILLDKRDIMQIIEAGLMLLGGAIILLYFTLKGRAVNHIWIAVALSILFFIVMLAIRKIQTVFFVNAHKLFYGIIVAICILGLVFHLTRTEWHLPELAVNSREDNIPEKLERVYNNDDLYIWGNWHKNITQTYMEMGKLPTKEFMLHNIPAGDWTYGQPYFNELLINIDAENPALALLERKHTYYVDDDCSFVLQYLREHYGIDIKAEQVGIINNVPVWQFSR